MSSSVEATSADAGGPGIDWGLIQRQIAGILRLELRRSLFSRRSFAVYFLAFSPVPIFLLWWFVAARAIGRHEFDIDGPALAAAQVFAPFFVGYLHTVVFLSALITFMSLYRSEILDRSLHYYYLAPVRRWVLVAGKYCSGLLSIAIVFAVAIPLPFLLVCVPWGFGEAARYIFSGPGLGYLVTYVGIAILGCVGYGAIFLLLGLFFRNGIVPAFFIWGWEAINFALPSLLKKASVIYYLKSLYPIPVIPELAFFEVVASEPTSPWISIPGLFIFTALVLTFAGWRARRMELDYGGD